jgi:hypothetical protein
MMYSIQKLFIILVINDLLDNFSLREQNDMKDENENVKIPNPEENTNILFWSTFEW